MKRLTHLIECTLLPKLFVLVYFQKKGVYSLFLLLLCFIEFPVFNPNSKDPDWMHFMASDLGLHCFPVTILGISQIKWVNRNTSMV